jgi:hypothetical protein
MFNPALLPLVAAYGDPREPVAQPWTNTYLSPMESPSESELSTSTLFDHLLSRITMPADKAVRNGSVTSQRFTEGRRYCSPMIIRSDVDLRIQDAHGNPVVYPVYACDHVIGKDLVILDQVVIDHLESIVVINGEKLNASGLHIKKFGRTLRKTERQRDSAVKAIVHAEKAEAEALTAFDMARQWTANALSEVSLLQHALQLAQRGYHDTKEEAAILRKALDRAHQNNNKLHRNTEARRNIMSTTKIEMIILRKDHESARTL